MKKVLYTMAMFCLVALFASCGESPAAMGEKLGKKVCDCMKMAENEPEKAQECMKGLEKEYNDAVASFKDDEQKIKEFDEAGEKASQECMK